MAKLIQEFATYGPRIDLKKAADCEDYMHRITNRSALNASETFSGMIKNSANIGLTREQYIAMWNREHPEDPILP